LKSLFLLTLLVCSLFAHKVNLFIVSENDTIDIYSYFANGNPCKNCKLIIKNDNTIILEDTLDNKGKYNYKTKYKNINFDLILSSDNNALDFLKKYRDTIFGDVPVSFSGVNE